MSSLIEKVAELHRLEADATPSPWNSETQFDVHDIFDNGKFLETMRNAAPAMLAVLAGFQPGDAAILGLFAEFMQHFKPDGHLNDTGTGAKITNAMALDCLRRMAEIARLMEAQ